MTARQVPAVSRSGIAIAVLFGVTIVALLVVTAGRSAPGDEPGGGVAGQAEELGAGPLGVPAPESTAGTTTELGEGTRRGAAGAPQGAGATASGGSTSWTIGPRPDGLAPMRFGVAVKGSAPGRLAALESAVGAEVGIVRVFARWDTAFPTVAHQALLDDGRVIHLSVRPRTDGGEVIPWSELATAEPGSDVYERLDELTTVVAGYGAQVYFTLNHEPETADSAANGTAEEFIAAWRRTVEMLRANGGDEVRTVLVLGGGTFGRGDAERWYPGDDVVDVIGADPYNWYRCQGTDRPWQSPAALIEAPLAFAATHGKPLALPEIASTEDPDDPDRKAEWIVDLATTLGSPEVAQRVEFVAWFSVEDRSWPECHWGYDSSPRSAAAFAGILGWFDPT